MPNDFFDRLAIAAAHTAWGSLRGGRAPQAFVKTVLRAAHTHRNHCWVHVKVEARILVNEIIGAWPTQIDSLLPMHMHQHVNHLELTCAHDRDSLRKLALACVHCMPYSDFIEVRACLAPIAALLALTGGVITDEASAVQLVADIAMVDVAHFGVAVH